MLNIIKLFIDLKSDIPDDLIAANSQFSAKSPKVIIDANNTVSGNTKGINFGQ